MALARDIVELAARLRETKGIDVFASLGRSGLLASCEFMAVVAQITSGSVSSDAAIRLCLQALTIQRQELQPKLVDAELVATLPGEVPGIVRPTESVIREMANGAEKEIIALGYEFSDPGAIELMANASTRGVAIIVICDRGRGSALRIRKSWPATCPQPRLFHDRERADAAMHASMHAKCLLVDAHDLLITSANFTFHGLYGNIELGVLLSGERAAEARKIFSYLVENKVIVELDA